MLSNLKTVPALFIAFILVEHHVLKKDHALKYLLLQLLRRELTTRLGELARLALSIRARPTGRENYCVICRIMYSACLSLLVGDFSRAQTCILEESLAHLVSRLFALLLAIFI